MAGSGFLVRENGMVRAPSGCSVRATMSTKAAHSVVFDVGVDKQKRLQYVYWQSLSCCEIKYGVVMPQVGSGSVDLMNCMIRTMGSILTTWGNIALNMLSIGPILKVH